MKFADNMRQNRLGIFSQAFNKMAGKPLNLREFQEQAQKAGWQEARVHYPGTSLLYQNDMRGKRITVDVSHTNVVQRFRFG